MFLKSWIVFPLGIFMNLFILSFAEDYVDELKSTDNLSLSDLLGNASNQSSVVGLDAYLSFQEMTSLIQRLQDDYPDLVRVHSLGKSVKGLDIWAVEITRNVRKERELLKPMFKYVANMHGDETVGYALMVILIQYLVYNYKVDDRITKLLDSVDVYILPTVNPDGFTAAQEGRCNSLSEYVGRKNANQVDLNRNFPDQFERVDKNYEKETTIMMNFIKSQPFVLSGNLHGGAIVASYPFDSSPFEENCCIESPTPDRDFFIQLAKDYASRNPMMAPGTACDNNFEGGITNGNYWYKVTGGMQDYNYVNSNCFEMTMELSCCKYPEGKTLKSYWAANKESLLNFMESTRKGIYGLIRDKTDRPVPSATITVRGNDKIITATSRGEYWRLLTPGEYTFTVSAPGYESVTTGSVEVTDGEPLRIDFSLLKSKRSMRSVGRKGI